MTLVILYSYILMEIYIFEYLNLKYDYALFDHYVKQEKRNK
jgi:hypothetical protein